MRAGPLRAGTARAPVNPQIRRSHQTISAIAVGRDSSGTSKPKPACSTLDAGKTQPHDYRQMCVAQRQFIRSRKQELATAAHPPGLSPMPFGDFAPQSRRDLSKIAQRFNAGVGARGSKSPCGAKEELVEPRASVVPAGTWLRWSPRPSVETLGYFQLSLRDGTGGTGVNFPKAARLNSLFPSPRAERRSATGFRGCDHAKPVTDRRSARWVRSLQARQPSGKHLRSVSAEFSSSLLKANCPALTYAR